MTARDIATSPTRLNLLRCALTGAATLGVLFAVCWAATLVGMTGPSHMFIALFTTAPVASTAALGIGLCWSLVFGAASGALVAVAYNSFGFLGRP